MPLSKIQTVDNQVVPNLGRRNLIINGAMQIAQRTTSDASISDNEFVVDRYSLRTSNSGWYSAEQSTDAPSDFSNSLKITSLGANSPAAGAYIFFSQKIEGFNSAHLKFGTSSAKTVTLSFHVKSSLTGTFAGSLRNSAQNRSYPFTFTISSANTYEYKTITIAGDTSGTWVGSTNGIGLEVIFNLGSGTNNQGTAGAWASAGYLSASGVSVKNLVETNGATLFISGIQLEVGSVATDFEHRSVGEEFDLCCRYFQKARQGLIGECMSTNGSCNWWYDLPTVMRATPSISCSTTAYRYGDMVQIGVAMSSISVNASGYRSEKTAHWNVTGTKDSGSPVQYRVQLLEPQTGSHGNFHFSAEL